ncbi:hypothetical protein C1646_752721 [Rhizophagus diaphanus]|nr:hypothetical protein C1646_752721 [Rhizophagus diaphanus] [Rhizophagus sp. MUCL 43196]
MSYLNEDCLRIVFIELKYDLKSLYSCILVNKFWYYVAIPILWNRNFDDTEISSNSKLYNTIIYLLPSYSKMLLINNIDNENITFSNRSLFNYINISPQVPSCFIKNMIETLIKKEDKYGLYKRNLLEREVYKLFISNCKDIKCFYLNTTQHLYQFPGALTCFSQICVLTINILNVSSTILFGMSKICKNVEDLTILYCDGDIPGLNRFIDVQTKLKSLRLEFNNVKKQCKELSDVIGRKAITLQEVEISLTENSLSPNFFPSLINLRCLRLHNSKILYDGSVEMKEWEKYLSISSFPNLQHLETTYLPFYNDYMLIEKSNGKILEINISQEPDSIYTKKLINSVVKYCPNLERLTIEIEFENLDDIKEIFLNCNQLRMINLSLYNENNFNCDKFFEILLKYSPKTLCKIYFSEEWIFTINGSKSFFENWNNWNAETSFAFYKVPLTDEHNKLSD